MFVFFFSTIVALTLKRQLKEMQTTEETVRHFIRELRVPDCCTFSLKVLVNFHLTFNDHFITAHALRCAKAAYGND